LIIKAEKAGDRLHLYMDASEQLDPEQLKIVGWAPPTFTYEAIIKI